jgi:hypothetical protein
MRVFERKPVGTGGKQLQVTENSLHNSRTVLSSSGSADSDPVRFNPTFAAHLAPRFLSASIATKFVLQRRWPATAEADD